MVLVIIHTQNLPHLMDREEFITVFKEIGIFSGIKFTEVWGKSFNDSLYTKEYIINELQGDSLSRLLSEKQVKLI